MTGKEALRWANGLPLAKSNALITTTKDATLRMVCQWRRDEPVAFEELLMAAGIIPLEIVKEPKEHTLLRRLKEGWVSSPTLGALVGYSGSRAQSAIYTLIARGSAAGFTLERQHTDGAYTEYRLVPA